MESFQLLKHALTTSPVLTSPNFEIPFVIQCDASNVGIGAVLFQADSEGGEHRSNHKDLSGRLAKWSCLQQHKETV